MPDLQFRKIDGLGLYRDHKNRRYPGDEYYTGISSKYAPVLALRHNLRGRVLRNTIYHEILHLLYPWRKHWWIECAAEILAGGGGRGVYSEQYGHTPEDLHKTREQLLTQVRRQVLRFNTKG